MVSSKEVQKISGLLKRTEYQIPIDKIQDMNFENKRAEYSNKYFTETLKRIKDSN